MSRTDKDRPFWVISNDPWATNSIPEHRCGGLMIGDPRECTLGTLRSPDGNYWDHCGNLDPREIFWYRGYEPDTTVLRSKKRRHTHDALREANTALRNGEFNDFIEDYHYPEGDSRHYEYTW